MHTKSSIRMAMIVGAAALALGTPQTVWAGETIPLVPDKLEPVNVDVQGVQYRGKSALRVVETPGTAVEADTLVVIPGEWTRVKIVVSGTVARLFVHDAEQPSLIVKDLKLGDAAGAVALWIGAGTEGHFASLRVMPQQRIKKDLREAPAYPEGRAVRLRMESAAHVRDVERLLDLKLGRLS